MVDNFVKIVESLAHLLSAFAWPFAFLVALRWFAPTLRSIFADKSDVSMTGFGVAITAKRESREAIALAEVSKSETSKSAPVALKTMTKSIGKSWAATQWISALTLDDTFGKTVLWVDDEPDNNVFERQAFEKLGITIDTAINTAEAIKLLNSRAYDVVISDMSRPDVPRAGYDLLARLKEMHPNLPFVLYSSSNTPEQEQAILEAGAFGSTSRASELIRLVTDAIKIHDTNTRREPRHLQHIRNLLSHRVTKGERLFD